MAKSRATRRLQRALQQAQHLDRPVAAPRLTRRRLLGTALAGAGLAAAPHLAFGRVGNPRIAIVGAGVAGLNAAWQLKRQGLDAIVYEARTRVGGRMLSRTGLVEAGIVDDIGGSLVNTDHTDLLGLLEAFDLSLYDRREEGDRLGIRDTGWYLGGRNVTEAEVAATMKPLAQQIIADARRVNASFDRLAPLFDDISVATYLDRHADLVRAPYARALVEASIRSEYGVEADASSALQLLFLLPTVRGNSFDPIAYSDEAFVVKEGSGQLPLRMADALGSAVRLATPLVALDDADGRYRLTFAREDGSREVATADIVILALPFTTLRRVALDLQLPPLMRRCIEEVDLGRNEKLFIGFDRRSWHRPDGFAVDFWSDRSLFNLAWDDSQRQPALRPGVLNAFYGGDQVDALLAASTDAAGRRALDLLDAAMPGMAGDASGRFLRTGWTRERYTRGAYVNLAPGQYMRFADYRWIEAPNAADRVEVVHRNLYLVGEHTSDEYYGFMNGAAQTGRLAAESILRRLG